MTDLSDEELERRMRRKLFLDSPSSRGQQFTAEERAIADKLVGRHNVKRLEHHHSDPRHGGARPKRFRPTPVFIHYEYWWVNSGPFMSGWKMAKVENGKRSDHHYTRDTDAEITRLKAAGFTVKEIRIEGAPSLLPEPRDSCVKRKSFSERYGNFAKVKP